MGVFRLILCGVFTLFVAACGNSGPGEQAQSSAMPSGDAASPADPATSCRLVMGWDPWEPYQYQVDGVHVFGLDVDLLTAVVRNADCELEFQQGSWTELLAMLENGQVDVLASATRTADREEFAYFSDPYRDEEFLMYVDANRIEELAEKSFEQMVEQGLKIGVVDGYLYGDPITAYQDDPRYDRQFEYSPMSELSFSHLLEGEVDLIVEDKYVGASIIRRKNLSDQVMQHPGRFQKSDVHFMLSRASVNDGQFQRINQSLNRLLADGQIQKILVQYQN